MEHVFANNKLDQDFFITIQSDKCKEFFPLYDSTSFSNVLYKSPLISANFYEVGISEIFFKYQESESVSLEPTVPVPKRFFNNSENDNLITTLKLKTSYIRFTKKNQNPVNFFEELSQYLIENPSTLTVHISKEYKFAGQQPYTILEFNDPLKEYELQIPSHWAEYFGFKSTTFVSGTFTSENPQSVESFNKIPLDDVIKFTLNRWEKNNFLYKSQTILIL